MSTHESKKNTGQSQGLNTENPHEPSSQAPEKALDFLIKNAKTILIVVVALILVAATWGGIQVWSDWSQQKDAEEFSQILNLPQVERLQKLTEYAPIAPKTIQGAALLELAGMLMEKEAFQEAATIWSQLAENSSGAVQWLAKLSKARCLLLAGEHDAAYTEMTNCINNAPKTMLVPSNRLLASCAEAVGDKSTAVKALQAILDSKQAVDAQLISYRIKQLQEQ